jgi:hypothetical protein
LPTLPLLVLLLFVSFLLMLALLTVEALPLVALFLLVLLRSTAAASYTPMFGSGKSMLFFDWWFSTCRCWRRDVFLPFGSTTKPPYPA